MLDRDQLMAGDDMRQMLRHLKRTIQHIVAELGGQLAQLLGDGVEALLLLPLQQHTSRLRLPWGGSKHSDVARSTRACWGGRLPWFMHTAAGCEGQPNLLPGSPATPSLAVCLINWFCLL